MRFRSDRQRPLGGFIYMYVPTEVATDVPSGFEPNNPERVNTWRARMAKLDSWLVRVDEIIAFHDNDPKEGSS